MSEYCNVVHLYLKLIKFIYRKLIYQLDQEAQLQNVNAQLLFQRLQ